LLDSSLHKASAEASTAILEQIPEGVQRCTLTVGTCYKNATKESLCSVLVAGL
jgi:hypothetical protein